MALVKKKKVPTNTTSSTKNQSKATSTTPAVTATKKTPVTHVKKIPTRKATIPQKQAEPKEVKSDVKKTPKPPVKRETGKSPEASKPIVASERPSTPARPKPTHTGAEKVSVEAMRTMSLEDRYKLWKSLNKSAEKFVAIRKELPKKDYMRKDEAILRKLIEEKPPKYKNTTVYYCPYCVDWQIFHYHSFTGYNKCTGCGITSREFYVAVDNGIFGKE